jgi:peptidoglycan/xylan/chitin deacetylase (PgdA/CDA1 family)
MANKLSARVSVILGLLVLSAGLASGQVGHTEITKWQYGKRAAVSVTFDDGSINQFRVAVPIMDTFGFPATFFIITGDIPGSRYHGTFIGRPTNAIVQETADTPTNKDNFLERASAIGFLGYPEAIDYHTRAGEVFDEGKDFDKAYQLMDEAYAKVRQEMFKAAAERLTWHPERVTWEELIALATRGYEFASHTVTHPRLAALDDANLVYELEKSRQDLLDHLGFKHTFSVECPYGTEDPRAVQFALKRYQVARNYMPDPFVDDLDRWNTMDPTASKKEYVRWQRGALTKTPMTQMKTWVDTVTSRDNIWLVLVFHGVNGKGWEPRTDDEFKEYFAYMKVNEDRLWIATFQDVTKYLRERMHSEVRSYRDGETILVVLRNDLTNPSYDLPVTLKTDVASRWQAAEIRQGERVRRVEVVHQNGLGYVLYQAVPNAEVVNIRPVER